MIIINREMSAKLMAHRRVTTLEICKPAPHSIEAPLGAIYNEGHSRLTFDV